MTAITLASNQQLVRTKPTASVWTRSSWSDPWTLQPNLLVEEIQLPVAAISQATFRHHYGRIMQRNSLVFVDVAPLDIADQWVKVQIVPEGADTDDVDAHIWFYGTLAIEQRHHMGAEVGGIPTGDQFFTAYGPEYPLSRMQISSAYVWDEDAAPPDYFIINRALNFNEFKTDRTGTRVLQGNKEPGKSYFAKVLKGADPWMASQIVNYLLERHLNNDDEPTLSAMDPDNAPLYFIDIDAGLDYQPRNIKTQGQTFFDVLNQLFNKKRGLAWWVESTGPDVELGFNIRVASMSDVTVWQTEFEDSLHENTSQVNIDLWDAVDLKQSVEVIDQTRKYSRIKVVGGKQGAVFSVSTGWNNLENDWTAQDVVNYNIAMTQEPGYLLEDRADAKTWNDNFRMADANRHVFTRFKVPQDWEGTVATPQTYKIAFPDFEHEDEIFTKQLSAVTHKRPLWLNGMRFLNYLPMIEGVDYSQAGEQPVDNNRAGSIPNYRKPFAVGQMAASKGLTTYNFLDAALRTRHDHEIMDPLGNKLSAHVRVHDHQFGLSLMPNGVGHILQKQYDYWDDATNIGMSHVDFGEVDMDHVTITVYAQCDHEVSFTYPRALTNVPWRHDERDVLLIRVGDRCRVDYLVPNTILGVEKSDSNFTNTTVENPNGVMIRDDRRMMMRIAFEAWQWYQTERKAIRLSFERLRGDIKRGMLVKRIQVADPETLTTPADEPIELPGGEPILLNDENGEQVNSIVSNLAYNVETGTTNIQTAFLEVDFAELVG